MSKKLFSVLVVLALVLCIFAMVGLHTEQVKATTFDNSNLVDIDGNADNGMQAACPHCKGEAVTWTELADCQGAGNMHVGYRHNAGKLHVYLSEDRTQLKDDEFMKITGTTELCLHLNGKNLTYRGRMQVGYQVPFTVMGNGNVTFLATATETGFSNMGLFNQGIATIYGGTWNNATGVTALGAQVAWGSGNPTLNITGNAHFIPKVECVPNVGRVMLDQNAVVNELDMQNASVLTIAGTWTGAATVTLKAQPDANGLYTSDRVKTTGAFTGVLTRNDGYRLVANNGSLRAVAPTVGGDLVDLTPGDGELNAVCPHCKGAAVGWKELTQSVSTASGHYYLAADLDATKGSFGSTLLSTSGTVCLHLNSKKLTTYSKLEPSSSGTVNVIAGNAGEVVFTGGNSSAKAFFFTHAGNFNIYGGTYTFAPVAGSAATGLARPAHGALNVYDATLNGDIVVDGSLSTTQVTINGSATVNGVADFSKTGKLILADGWSGTIREYKPYAAAMNDYTGVLASGRIVVEDSFTGTIGSLAWNGSNFAAKAAIMRGDVAVPFGSAAAAAAAYTESDFTAKNVIRLFDDGTVELAAGKNYYIDAKGRNVTVTGSGTLYPMDSANDKYDAAKCGQWTITTGENGATVVNDVTNCNRYITIKEGDYYTAHRLEMKLTHVTLKTSAAGIYFKAEYKCDDVLAARVIRYGTAISKNAIPNAVGQTGDSYTELTSGFTPDTISHSLHVNSGAVVNILKDDPTINNKERAEMTLYAKVYFTVDIDGTNELDCLSTQGGSYSLYDVLNAIDSNWGEYNETERTLIHNFYNAWMGKGATGCCIEDLGFTNIPDASKLAYTLKVGYAYFDITPDAVTLMDLILGGRGTGSNTPSGSIMDKLPGTCVAFKDENDQIVLMYTLDILGAYQDIMDFVADISTGTGIPQSGILINTTHSHSAPHPSAALYPQNAAYISGLKQKMITAGIAAIADLQPAQMHVASVTVPNMNSVRHYLMSDGTISGDNFGNWEQNVSVVKPVEDADNTLQLIKFTRGANEEDILLMNWQGHPNRKYQDMMAIISGLERMRAELEKNHNTLLAFFLGASGNVNNSSRVPAGTTYYEQYGVPTMNDYAQHYAALLQKALSASFAEVPVGKLQVLEKTVSLVAADEASLKDMSIYGFAIGDQIAFALAPYEMFNGSGLFIKENSPYAMTFVSTCAMGANSYIPTDEVYVFEVVGVIAGENHPVYEVNGCLFARGTAEELAREYVTLLRELKAG